MTRVEFTDKINTLLMEMILAGHNPMIDFCLRSKEEQKRLFDLGLSKCDGTIKLSAHQSGKAMDIYFADLDADSAESKAMNRNWHKRWAELAGKPMIEWDAGHYEG